METAVLAALAAIHASVVSGALMIGISWAIQANLYVMRVTARNITTDRGMIEMYHSQYLGTAAGSSLVPPKI